MLHFVFYRWWQFAMHKMFLFKVSVKKGILNEQDRSSGRLMIKNVSFNENERCLIDKVCFTERLAAILSKVFGPKRYRLLWSEESGSEKVFKKKKAIGQSIYRLRKHGSIRKIDLVPVDKRSRRSNVVWFVERACQKKFKTYSCSK